MEKENEFKEIEAIQLIDRAENLADKGHGNKAIELYEKAAQTYLDLGSYIKLDEVYIRIANIIAQFKSNIQAIHRLKSIIRKTEELKLSEISAKLHIQVGNIAYKMNDYETAGESWHKASDLLWKTDSDEYLKLSSILLLKAGQTYEKSPTHKDMGKRLILRSLMKIHKFDELYQEEEKRAYFLINNKEFSAAANKLNDIANYFKKALNDLGDLIDENESKETMINAKARLIHFIAEYLAVAAVCLRAAKDKTFNEKIKQYTGESIELFKQSITLLKEYLLPITGKFDKEIIYRITFDTMICAIIQDMVNEKKINPIDFLLEGLESNKDLIKNLKGTPYFAIIKSIERIGVLDSLGKLSKVNLGHFEKIKIILITYFN